MPTRIPTGIPRSNTIMDTRGIMTTIMNAIWVMTRATVVPPMQTVTDWLSASSTR
jgi:hypothetical protein